MVKKRVKQELKKSDIVIETFAYIVSFIRTNLRYCIAGAVAVVIIAGAVYSYALYERKKDERAQEMLFQGIASFEQYSVTGKEEDRTAAEGTFRKLVDGKQGKAYVVAQLYLGKIEYSKGKKEEARKLYAEVINNSSSPTLKSLSRKALDGLEPKQP